MSATLQPQDMAQAPSSQPSLLITKSDPSAADDKVVPTNIAKAPATELTANNAVPKERASEQVQSFRFLHDFMRGGVVAAVSKTLVAPIERVKLLLQLQDASTQIRPEDKYKGLTDCFRRVYREQGFLSYYRGNWANVVRYFPTQAFNFAFKDSFYKKYFLDGVDKNKTPYKFMWNNIVSGGLAGCTTGFIVYPIDVARTRLAADVGVGNSRQYKGMVDIFIKLARSDGMVGLYRGFVISSFGYFIYRGIYFGVYDATMASMKKEPGLLFKGLVAQTVVIVSTMASYPIDTVRRRMMMQSGRTDILYSGTMDCIRKILQQEGWAAMFKGAWSNTVRGIGSALVLVGYDEVSKYI